MHVHAGHRGQVAAAPGTALARSRLEVVLEVSRSGSAPVCWRTCSRAAFLFRMLPRMLLLLLLRLSSLLLPGPSSPAPAAAQGSQLRWSTFYDFPTLPASAHRQTNIAIVDKISMAHGIKSIANISSLSVSPTAIRLNPRNAAACKAATTMLSPAVTGCESTAAVRCPRSSTTAVRGG